MKKRIIAGLLTGCVLVSSLAVPAAAAANDTSAVQAVQALGILTADDSGELQLSAPLTRAQLAVMLVESSSVRDSIDASTAGMASFRDVSRDYWASAYIRKAAQGGWIDGYTDGTFHPDDAVTVEEVCAGLLRLLGYTAADLSGAYPDAQMNKANQVGILKNLNLTAGETVTRSDASVLFFNAMNSTNKDGKTYATTIGYTVGSSGEVDYTAAEVKSLQGPFVADENTVLPFAPVKIYRNGYPSESAELTKYDVYYYNPDSRSLWIFTRRSSGRISALSPSSTDPTSVTLAGTTYNIGTAEARYQLSALAGSAADHNVTLLLGMDDAVVSVLTNELTYGTYYGIIESTDQELVRKDKAVILQSVNVTCSDGVVRTFYVDKGLDYQVGLLVEVNVTSAGSSIKTLPQTVTGSFLTGTVNAEATKLGDYTLAPNIEILDVASGGTGVTVRPARLSGITLDMNSVRFYLLDEQGRISKLILNNVTGDVYDYGIITEITKSSSATYSTDEEDILNSVFKSLKAGTLLTDVWTALTEDSDKLLATILNKAASAADVSMQVGAQYTYLCKGETKRASAVFRSMGAYYGPAAILLKHDGSTVKNMAALESLRVSSLNGTSVTGELRTIGLADDVQIYIRKHDTYMQVSMADIDVQNYSLTAYYDSFGCAAGTKVRIILATPK